jgi:hypothetical protein
LRFIVWIKHKIDPSDEGLTLLLHHPRYCPLYHTHKTS